jgi:hypothetical protein
MHQLAPPRTGAAAAKQKHPSARTALPWIDPQMAQHALLQKAAALYAHGGAVLALGAYHFFGPCHDFLFLEHFRNYCDLANIVHSGFS